MVAAGAVGAGRYSARFGRTAVIIDHNNPLGANATHVSVAGAEEAVVSVGLFILGIVLTPLADPDVGDLEAGNDHHARHADAESEPRNRF
jgi:hypothetical protein